MVRALTSHQCGLSSNSDIEYHMWVQIWNAWTCFNDYFRIPKCYVGKQITIYHDQLPLTIYKFLDPNSLSGNCVHNIYFNVHNVMVSLNGRPSGEGVLVQTLVNISNRTEPAVLSNKTLK